MKLIKYFILYNGKAINSLFTDLKNRTMEDITKELNAATQYLRVMKRTGNHKEDCDNVLTNLANIEDLVNKFFIANVSKSFSKDDMKTAFTQARCNKKTFNEWFNFNYY